jgi:hypothetical protein
MLLKKFEKLVIFHQTFAIGTKNIWILAAYSEIPVALLQRNPWASTASAKIAPLWCNAGVADRLGLSFATDNVFISIPSVDTNKKRAHISVGPFPGM